MCVHQEFKGIPEHHVGYERGRPMPMFLGASSKIILANLSSRSTRWFFTRFQLEIAEAGLGNDWEQLKANLRRIRKAGVCVTGGEVDSGRVGIAAPVFELNGNVIGSVGLVLFDKDATPENIANCSALVQAAAREIDASLLAHTPPADAKDRQQERDV
jgi:DNA-binding IclR family transcriptional regulator